MDESQLYSYALISVLIGFLVLGYVVLFIPIAFSDSNEYFDGVILNKFDTKKGDQIIIVQETIEHSILLNSNESADVGSSYRFYDLVSISKPNEENPLMKISFFRKLNIN